VEWGELAASVFGRDVLTIEFSVLDDETRLLTVAGELTKDRAEQLDAWAS
jgi:hypothetical protein